MARYEELRRGAVTAGSGSSRSHTYALFVHRGMAAWMQAWTELFGDASSKQSQPRRASSAGVIPRALGSEVVLVLAGMALEREKAGDLHE